MKKPVAVRRLGLLPALLLVLLLGPGLRPAPAADPPATRLEMAGIAGGEAALEFAAAPLVTMTTTAFRLALTDGAGRPVTGATVECDLSMPAMPMPENRPAVHETGPGLYRGEAVFTMAGAWQAAFTVGLPAGGKEILLFDIERVQLR